MRILAMALSAALVCLGGAAHAGCMPVKSEVVSVGEKAARSYSDRSLATAIDNEKERIATTGLTLGPISKSMACAPFPNLIGADEWKCVGEGKVCSK